ncbi:enoyl-CoA hydratase/isomerase family protein [Pollutimonas bauzanensis]|uniref:enoyl-CoA hydratase/isomerase family protein n=1 Tax=Pollutimonas bauzanensis TaxID=658167 RepID=UPI00333FA178
MSAIPLNDAPSMDNHAQTQEAPGLLIHQSEGCWVFELNRPEKMNALSAELVESLIEGLSQARQQQVDLLVFRGTGRNFSAGFDFTGFEDQSEGDLALRFIRLETLLQSLASMPCHTLALAHGRNFGAGVDLFAVCKQRVCTEDSTFRMPGLKFGLVLGSRRFATIVGNDTALQVLGTTKTFTAQEAVSMRFVHSVATNEQWEACIDDAHSVSIALDRATRSTFYRVMDVADHATDMAELVRSATTPGLKNRIRNYLKK